jgi:hypothetical protein
MGLGLNGSIVNGVLNAFLSPVQDWLSQHPRMVWLLANPGWLLVALVVALFLLSGLLRAVASLTEKLWLGLLKLPIRLVQWIWQGSLFLLRRPAASPSSNPTQTNLLLSTHSPDRLTEVLDRLETLRHEQDELMQEMKSLLNDSRQKQS